MNLFTLNPELAFWHKGVDNKPVTKVKAIISKDVKSPVEHQSRSGYRIKGWSEHVHSIRRANNLEWGEAVKTLTVKRSNSEPVEMLIYERDIDEFIDTEVVEYCKEA